MKKLILILFTGIAFSFSVKAQVNLTINLGAQPQWGPSGYNHAEYYYLPDIETYYYVPKRQFIYLNKGSWVFSPNLPARHSGYNLYNGYKVVFNSPRPYRAFKDHKVKYAKFKNYGGRQETLKNKGNSRTRSGYVPRKGHDVKKVHPAGKANGNVKGKGGEGKAKGSANGKGKH